MSTQQTLNVNPHTLFLTIGPSNAGKSYYCKNHLIPQLSALSPLPNRENVQVIYISSDDTRRELLHENYPKHHPAMMAVSRPAFDLLYQKVKSAMAFPVNAEFIIVDTKGTNDKFREDIYRMAVENRYSVVPVLFNYSDFDEYAKHGSLDKRGMIDIKKTRMAMVGIKRIPVVKGLLQIKSNDFSKAPTITCEKHELLQKCVLLSDKEVVVVSDIHGCYDEFVELMEESRIKIENYKITENPLEKRIVIAGDYLDSGPKSADMIDFIFENPEVTVVMGNHENRLYRELVEGLEHIEEPYFDSFHKLSENEKERFIHICEYQTVPFLMNDRFVITHAPCSASSIGKVDMKSMSRQRYFPHGTDDKVSLYEDMNKLHVFDADMGNMLHVFGHIPTTNPGSVIQNRMLIDGGCVLGRKLVSVSLSPDGRYFVKSVDSKQPKPETIGIPPKKYAKPITQKEVDLSELSFKERERIRIMASHKVNFISGTMSPCDKTGDILESIESGIEFFKGQDVTDVVMEPKYMGSRCNLYLFGTNEESYAVSRNGYKINMDLSEVFDSVRERLKEYFDWNELRFVLLDGELMPWSALGEGLIQEFRIVADNVDQENRFLEENGFDSAFSELTKKFEESGFLEDRNVLQKKEMIEKYGNANYETYKMVDSFHGYIPVEERKSLNGIYKKQMEYYGTAGKTEYKPFAILKIVKKSGEEVIPYFGTDWTNASMFDILNPDGCHVYDFSDEKDVSACIEQFRKYTTDEHFEGVVLKPNSLKEKRVPPYMKVRNPDYLTIIYGYDYLSDEKHKKLCSKKSIRGKIAASIREWKTGLSLLSIRYDDISKDNEELKKLYASFIFEEKKEEELDPRL